MPVPPISGMLLTLDTGRPGGCNVSSEDLLPPHLASQLDGCFQVTKVHYTVQDNSFDLFVANCVCADLAEMEIVANYLARRCAMAII